ncbi:hypothetical protein AB0383_20290 [Amycolatopsis sp. NPDC051373]|uniref:hypothetical protein n=1 Tax=Amycolatopsis sp. NPDC051373 TaxID=3155801 RepID=UPI00344F9385
MKKVKKPRGSFGTFAGVRVQYRAGEVLPNTPYPDEPSEMIPPGWYVIGRAVDDHAEDQVVIAIDEAFGDDGEDLRGQIAEAVAAGLNGSVVGNSV